MTKHLDLIIVSDFMHDVDYADQLGFELRKVAEKHNFTYNARTEPDVFLTFVDFSDRNYLPEGAMVYVHGEKRKKHPHLGLVLESSPKRPDLRFIMDFDIHNNSSDFQSTELYQAYRALPFLNYGEEDPSYLDAKIVAFYKNREFFPELEEGSRMTRYILHLLEGRQ